MTTLSRALTVAMPLAMFLSAAIVDAAPVERPASREQAKVERTAQAPRYRALDRMIHAAADRARAERREALWARR